MKLVRFGDPGEEKPGVVDIDGCIRDLSEFIPDINGNALSSETITRLRRLSVDKLPEVSENVRLGPCINGVGKFICIGLNYHKHVAEAGAEIPVEPVVFMKATSALSGPFDSIMLPRNSTKTDWEVELGVVIGKEGSYISEKNSANHIAGFCVVNDISERSFQLEGTGQWVKGKSADTFGPIGPWLVTSDEVQTPQDLNLWLSVNDQQFQSGNTGDMIFDINYIVSYLSQYMSLQPGDIISTGTPVGVGMGQHPQRFLEAGDKVTLGIDSLGEQEQIVIPFSKSGV